MSESEPSEAGVQHVDRVEEGLAEMRHLQYVTVEEAPYDSAAVRVRDDGAASNPLVNNGMFELFHRLGYVGHHVGYRERYIDLRYIGGEGGGD